MRPAFGIADLPPRSIDSAEKSMTKLCSKCNQQNPPDAAFCLNCASPLNVGPTGQQQYQQPIGSPPAAGSGSGQKAIIALVLAILALICCGPFAGVPAAIVGWMELDAIKNGRSPAGGKTMATIGLWGGVASSVIHIIFYVIWVLMGMLSAASSPYGY